MFGKVSCVLGLELVMLSHNILNKNDKKNTFVIRKRTIICEKLQ